MIKYLDGSKDVFSINNEGSKTSEMLVVDGAFR